MERPARGNELVIGADGEGQRLDNFLLRTLKGWPKSRVYRLIRSGQVRANSRRVKPDYRLQAGDRLRLPPQAVGDGSGTSDRRPPPNPELLDRVAGAVLEERATWIALDKPAGIPVHGGSGQPWGLIEALRRLRPNEPALELVHRLDRDTSGCLLVARRRSALRALHAQFREGTVEKRYLTLVRGRWQRGEDTVTLALDTGARRAGERHVRVGEAGKPATTRFRVLERYREATLLEALPDTGRTHQIRVHAAAVDHPVAGDERYGDAEFNAWMRARCGLRRLFLHAHALGFTCPSSGEAVTVSTPLAEDLRRAVEALSPR